MRLLVGALALCALLTVLLGVGNAMAARGLMTGFADPLFESSNPGERALWLDRSVQSGAGIVRLGVGWGAVAPTRPPDPDNAGSLSYHFDPVDAAVRDARARGLTVMLTVSGAPDWAEGPGRPSTAVPGGSWKPDPSSLASFMRAVAQRYSGDFDPDGPGSDPAIPAVQAVEVWNEPNLQYLTPQYEGSIPFSPDYYRTMLNASYAAVKSVDPAILVVTGGTAPYGGPSVRGLRLRPVEFDRRLMCLRKVRPKHARPPKKKKKTGKRRKRSARLVRDPSCGPRVNFDILAHHPINTSGGPRLNALNPDDASSADLGRISRVLRAAEKGRTISPGKHPLWATEIWWDSNPPNRAGSPLRRQARWVEQSLYLLWRAGASAAVNLFIRDPSAVSSDLLDGYGSGIYFTNEQAKPSSIAFRFPFVADRRNKKTLVVWGKAPAAGTLSIQRRARHRWVNARRLKVKRGAVFAVRLRLEGSQTLRGRVAGVRSLVWKQK
jgi:hypothetical protein